MDKAFAKKLFLSSLSPASSAVRKEKEKLFSGYFEFPGAIYILDNKIYGFKLISLIH